MAAPAPASGPDVATADPASIRARLPDELRPRFDAEWSAALDAAKTALTLDGVRHVLVKWRHVVRMEERPGGGLRSTPTGTEHRDPLPPPSPAGATQAAIASLRVDGMELDESERALLGAVAEGELTHDEAVARILAPYRG